MSSICGWSSRNHLARSSEVSTSFSSAGEVGFEEIRRFTDLLLRRLDPPVVGTYMVVGRAARGDESCSSPGTRGLNLNHEQINQLTSMNEDNSPISYLYTFILYSRERIPVCECCQFFSMRRGYDCICSRLILGKKNTKKTPNIIGSH